MRTDEERQEIIEQAEKEIQEICSKYNLTFDATGNIVFLNHHEQHESGDFSIRGREVNFAPYLSKDEQNVMHDALLKSVEVVDEGSMSALPTCSIADSDLVGRAVRNAKNHSPCPTMPRWYAVRTVFGCGSTAAAELCRRYGLDPDDELPSTCNGGEDASK